MSHSTEISRLRFLKMALAGCLFAPGLTLLGSEVDQLRGDRVGWARLKTPSPSWNRHAGSDPLLMRFFHEQTTLNIDPDWYTADPADLTSLTKYPFIFSQGVAVLVDPVARGNVVEFIRRGGFLMIDGCHDEHVNPNLDEYFSQQLAFFSTMLPEAQVVSLPKTHEVYRCFFQIPDGEPPHMFTKYGLYGLMIGTRMAGLISLSGLQCAWDVVTEHRSPAPPGTEVLCMRMLVNIYIYAMMQGS
jgi:hypothetical protein